MLLNDCPHKLSGVTGMHQFCGLFKNKTHTCIGEEACGVDGDCREETFKPRVLTYNDAKDLADGVIIWIEFKRKPLFYPVAFKCFTVGEVYKWFNFHINESLKAMNYDGQYRFWIGKPTPELRKATKWRKFKT